MGLSSALLLLLAAMTLTVTLAEYDPSIGANICADEDWQCAVDYTCCKMSDGSTACCPFTLANCCVDSDTCCPAGFSCGVRGQCERIQ